MRRPTACRQDAGVPGERSGRTGPAGAEFPSPDPSGGLPLSSCRWGIVVFPGTNCEYETRHVLGTVLGQPVRFVWHRETDLSDLDAVVVPGGFAHGDYLRAGAIARFSPVMEALSTFAAAGKPVLGICNGFQVLVEAGLLPGAMLRNQSQRFLCRWVNLRVESTHSPFLAACRPGQVLRMPMAHGEGCYYADPETLAAMESRGQIVFRYAERDGRVTPDANPNGSVGNIAGVSNAAGNVLGLMPHPERASEALLGSDDGRALLAGLLALPDAGGTPAFPGSGAGNEAGA